jgi:hypothetical protein
MDEKTPAGLEATRHDKRPALEVGKPPQHTDRREYDVELALEARRRVVHVAADEFSGRCHFRGELARLGHGRRHEIHAGDGGAVACPRQRVEAEMALQMQQRLSAHIAYAGQRDRAQRLAARDETGNVVSAASNVIRRPRLPHSMVGGDGGAVGVVGHEGSPIRRQCATLARRRTDCLG